MVGVKLSLAHNLDFDRGIGGEGVLEFLKLVRRRELGVNRLIRISALISLLQHRRVGP